MEDAPDTVATPQRTIGRFRIEGPIGAGGMGEVYAAYDPLLARRIALKILSPSGVDGESEQRRRVLREARAAAALAHPNVVKVFDVGEADGVAFLAMELLEGESLRGALARSATLEQKLVWLLDAARALSEAHERGLVHRDVKPENMFVCKDGALKLLDFGIAKHDDDERAAGDDGLGPSSLRTGHGRVVGTPRYMSPEQRSGAPTDARTDQYSWGLVAFELLTGVRPVSEVSTVKLDATAHGSGEPRPTPLLAHLLRVDGLREDLARAIARTVEPRREDRFDSMAPLVVLLERPRAARSPRGGAGGDEHVPRAAEDRPPRRRVPVWTAVALCVAMASVAALLVVARASSRAPAEAVTAGRDLCVLEHVRVFPVGAENLITVLPGGALVVARWPEPRYEREIDGKLVDFDPFHPEPQLARKAWMDGATLGGKPALVLTQASPAGFAMGTRRMADGATRIWTEGRVVTVRGASAPLAALGQAVTQFGEGLVVALIEPKPTRGPALFALQLFVFDGVQPEREPPPALPLDGVPSAIEIAPSPGGLGVVYASTALFFRRADAEGRFAEEGAKVFDAPQAAALEYLGDRPVILFVARDGEVVRLYSSVGTPAGTSFAPPRVASAEPAGPARPKAFRLPSGTPGVVWSTRTGASQTMKLAAIRDDGTLGPAVPLGQGRSLGDPRVALTPRGVEVAWVDEVARTASVATVACSGR